MTSAEEEVEERFLALLAEGHLSECARTGARDLAPCTCSRSGSAWEKLYRFISKIKRTPPSLTDEEELGV